jgi:hypothetical protein
MRAGKGEVIVQATRNPLYHPFAKVMIGTDFPKSVANDSWTKSQIAAGLLQVVK